MCTWLIRILNLCVRSQKEWDREGNPHCDSQGTTMRSLSTWHLATSCYCCCLHKWDWNCTVEESLRSKGLNESSRRKEITNSYAESYERYLRSGIYYCFLRGCVCVCLSDIVDGRMIYRYGHRWIQKMMDVPRRWIEFSSVYVGGESCLLAMKFHEETISHSLSTFETFFFFFENSLCFLFDPLECDWWRRSKTTTEYYSHTP